MVPLERLRGSSFWNCFLMSAELGLDAAGSLVLLLHHQIGWPESLPHLLLSCSSRTFLQGGDTVFTALSTSIGLWAAQG